MSLLLRRGNRYVPPPSKGMSPSNPPSSRERRCEKIVLVLFRVIPAEAGIQYFHHVTNRLDSGFHRGDG